MKIPYIPADTQERDSSIKAIVFGVVFGAIFGSANAYLGLRVGLTISTAIPLAVISVAVFRALRPILGKTSILECNIAQTAGSSSSSLASGVIFTIPALFMWGLWSYPNSLSEVLTMALRITPLAIIGGAMGILFMVPLRRFLIIQEHENLPYPEGTAAAQVLIASEEGGATAKYVLKGLGIGALYKAFLSFGKIIPGTVALRIPVLPKAVVEMETMPALLGVGYILNYRVSAIMASGGILAWLVLIPTIAFFGDSFTHTLCATPISEMSAGQIWKNYIKYIGAGAVAFAGIITVVKSLPTMISSLKIGMQQIFASSEKAEESQERTARELSMLFVVGGITVLCLLLAFVPQIIGGGTSLPLRIVASLCIAIFAFLFVTVSSRIVGLIGVSSNPTSGMTIVTLIGTSLAFYMLGWTGDFGKAAVITIGTAVCVAASIAGDISQDLKSGYLLGATPKKQQIAELLGAVFSAFFVCLAVVALGKAFEFGSMELAAPQATLMKTIVGGVLSAKLPWALIMIGASIALVTELLGLPSLAFAVGVYLPLSAMMPVFLGGVVRRLCDRKKKSSEEDEKQGKEQGVLLSSGFIAGEGIMGILLAIFAIAYTNMGKDFKAFHGLSSMIPIGNTAGQVLSFGLFLALAAYLFYTGSKRE